MRKIFRKLGVRVVVLVVVMLAAALITVSVISLQALLGNIRSDKQ